MNRLPNGLTFSHQLLREAVASGDNVIDGTVGNGHDTLLLATLVGAAGQVYGFDIQEPAIQATKRLLTQHKIDPTIVKLYQKSHAEIDTVLPTDTPISAAIFNLGYLPGGSKAIITKPASTLVAIKACLKHLKKFGLVIVVVYYGHPGGLAEKQAILDFCQKLPQKRYSVLNYGFINQVHEPPFVLAIQKIN
ncbi:class I SAM-dependent methyltransferase [Lentilactobacillus raoultii]|uniref:Class I SAM-dependent methyltransferase n=1 Tax=Lentilactobacillus raoultii TaxID=1987503 RepID=A0ABW3PE46_9LACO|nr:class I SAM-dependent methyltransferase [Lentilactobacillus raoultii]